MHQAAEMPERSLGLRLRCNFFSSHTENTLMSHAISAISLNCGNLFRHFVIQTSTLFGTGTEALNDSRSGFILSGRGNVGFRSRVHEPATSILPNWICVRFRNPGTSQACTYNVINGRSGDVLRDSIPPRVSRTCRRPRMCTSQASNAPINRFAARQQESLGPGEMIERTQ